MSSSSPKRDDLPDAALQAHHPDGVAPPAQPPSDLLGNFADFDSLFEQLNRPPLIELGNPLPKERYLPKKVGSCPAAHNRALLGDGKD